MDLVIFEPQMEIRESEGLALGVGDVEDGNAMLLLGALEQMNEIGLRVLIHRREGFVEEEDSGLGGEGAGEGDALLFTAGEALREAVEEVADAHFGGERFNKGGDGVGRGFLETGGEADLLGNGEGGEERAILGDKADAAIAGRRAGDIAMIDPDASALRKAEPAEDFDERGLARAGAAHENGIGAAGHFEADVLEGEGTGFPGDVVEADHEGVRGEGESLRGEPGVEVLGDEGVVVKMRVGAVDAIDVGELAGAEGLVLVKAPESGEETLTAEDFMQARNAAAEGMGGVEEGGVAVGDLDGEAEEVGRGVGEAAALMKCNRLLSPDGPVAEEAAGDAEFNRSARAGGDAEGSQEIGHDGVIVAGVESDVVAPGLGDGAEDVEGLVAVEGSDLDGDDVVDFDEASPKGIGQRATADAGLEVKADDGEDVGDGATVVDEVVLAGVMERGETEEPGVVAEAVEEGGFLNRLRRGAADAANADDGPGVAVHCLGGEGKHGFEEADAGLADGELGGVDTDRETTGPCGEVVAGERALAALVETAGRGEGQRMGGDGEPGLQRGAEVRDVGGGGGFRIDHPGLRSGWVC